MKSKRVYFYAPLVTISVILLNQFFIQYWLFQKRQDANIINISGRQWMLSQRLLALQYAYHIAPTPTALDNLKEVDLKWEQSHDFLLNTFRTKKTLMERDQVFLQLKALSPYIQNANAFIHNSSRKSDQQLMEFKLNQEEYLDKMDRVVSILEKDSQLKLTLVIVIEIIFALCSLFLIYYEITYIFRRINRDLEHKNEALEESNKMLEQYAYLAAHDLKSPTQNVINFAKVLRQRLTDRLQKIEEEYFSYILDSAERLKRTTDDLLQFSTINNETVNIETLEPQKIFDEVLKDLATNIEAQKALIDIGQLPTEIKGDRHLLHLVFQNLIANSLKFIDGDKTPNIQINYQNEEDLHVFAIKDNGIGIAEKDRTKIFGWFKRLHRHESYPGTGIGLSICQKIIEKHQGSLSLDSQVQKGSTFYVKLPKHLSN